MAIYIMTLYYLYNFILWKTIHFISFLYIYIYFIVYTLLFQSEVGNISQKCTATTPFLYSFLMLSFFKPNLPTNTYSYKHLSTKMFKTKMFSR